MKLFNCLVTDNPVLPVLNLLILMLIKLTTNLEGLHFVSGLSFAFKFNEALYPSYLLKAKTRLAAKILDVFIADYLIQI